MQWYVIDILILDSEAGCAVRSAGRDLVFASQIRHHCLSITFSSMLHTHLRPQGPVSSEYLDHDLQRTGMKRARYEFDDHEDNHKRSKLDPAL